MEKRVIFTSFIPYYLNMLEKGLQIEQNVDNLFYRYSAPLRTEYHVIDVGEMKYCQSLFSVTSEYEKRGRERNEAFLHFTKAKDAIHNFLVTTYGLRENLYSGTFLCRRYHG